MKISRSFCFAVFAASTLVFGQGEVASTSGGAAKPSLAAILEAEAYSPPPQAILDFINAPRHKNVALSNLSPDGRLFLISESSGMASLADLGKHWHNLAGVSVDPAANRARSLTTGTTIGLTLFDWKTGAKTAIEVPKGAKVGSPAWSPDGSKLAFLVHTDDAARLAVADCSNGKSRIVNRAPLMATQVTRPEWSADGKHLFAVFVPEGAKAPQNGAVATQPTLRLSDPSKNPTRTVRSLLQTSQDQALFEHFTTGQLAKVDVSSGRMEKVGAPRMYRSIDPSPDGKFVRVTVTQKPFSYIVPSSSFGSLEEVVDLTGKQLVEVRKSNLRLGGQQAPDPDADEEYLPPHYDWADRLREEREQGRGQGGGRFGGGGQGGGPQSSGRRSLGWAPDGSGMVFLQIEPREETQGSQPQTPPRRKDRLMRWLPPFGKDDQKVIYETEGSISNATFGSDGKTLFITEASGGTTTTYAVSLVETSKKVAIQTSRTPAPVTPGQPPRQADDSFYDNPGTWVTRANGNGISTIRVSPKGEVFLSGTQYFKDPEKEAPRPFLDAVSLADGKKRRVWQSSPDIYEAISAYLDDEGSQLVLNRQSATMLPNSYLASTSGGEPQKLTKNFDYIPAITQAQRHRVQVTRADGFKFWVEVTVPTNYNKGERLPAFFWFYPSEYNDQAGYDRSKRSFNKNQFQNVSATSKDLLILFGYAVVEPDCPIIGPQGRMNDSYVPDLRNNLSATIDELDRQGFIDRTKLGIGGHSYGAFSTANAMVHTPFFKAGIAGDGAYNRMLTPMAFQTEQRLLWEARETYLTMSPMLYAEQLNGALLLYHGEADQNVGTHPINSERMFHALDGLGKTVAMYMYPYEDHGQVARETVLDQWARWVAWLEKYVKGVK